jgi:transcriptional regulator with XRE-family HTH domain
MLKYIVDEKLYEALTVGIPQKKISKDTGISEQYLIKIKKGETTTTLNTATKLAYYLDVQIDQLFKIIKDQNYTSHNDELDEKEANTLIRKGLFRTIEARLAHAPDLQQDILALFNRVQVEATYEGILIERAGKSDAFMPTLIKYRRGED